MSWVWNNSRSRGNDRLVLLAIADSAEDDGGNAWPSQERLARKTGLTVRTVRTSIDRLRQINELAVEHRRDSRGRQDVSTYAVLMHGRRKDLPPDHRSEGTPSSSHEAPPPPHRRQNLPADVSGTADPLEPEARGKALPPTPPEDNDTVRRQTLPPYRGDPSGDPSDPPVVPPGDAPPARWPRFTAEGHALALELWFRLDPKPIAGFGGFRERLSQCLAAGYTADALRRVAGHVDVWSRPGIEMAFAKSGVNPKAPAPPAVSHPTPAGPPPVVDMLRAWETLSDVVKESAEAEVRRRHPNAAAWGDGVLWRALVVEAAKGHPRYIAP